MIVLYHYFQFNAICICLIFLSVFSIESYFGFRHQRVCLVFVLLSTLCSGFLSNVRTARIKRTPIWERILCRKEEGVFECKQIFFNLCGYIHCGLRNASKKKLEWINVHTPGRERQTFALGKKASIIISNSNMRWNRTERKASI